MKPIRLMPRASTSRMFSASRMPQTLVMGPMGPMGLMGLMGPMGLMGLMGLGDEVAEGEAGVGGFHEVLTDEEAAEAGLAQGADGIGI